MGKHVYPAIITIGDDGLYSANFPDFKNCHADGDNIDVVMERSADVLAHVIYSLEREDTKIPPATPIKSLTLTQNQLSSLIIADTDKYRELYDGELVKVSMSLPAWLKRWVDYQDISLTAFIRRALKKELKEYEEQYPYSPWEKSGKRKI